MGCWNKTCGLSNLHITVGTPTYVFVLEEGKDNSNCYTTSLFSPLLLPFEAEYDDYGGGENSHGVALDFIMNGLKKNLVELEVGENKYHDIAVKKEDFTPEKFFEACHEDRMSLQGPLSDKATRIQFTMFRKDVVDEILEKREIEDYVGNGQGTCGWNNNYVRYKFKDIIADIRPLLDAAIEELANCDKEERIFKSSGGFEYMNVRNLEDNKVIKWMRGDSYRYSRIVDMKQVISKALSIGTFEAINKLEQLLIEHLKAIFIDGFMHSARKTWIPGGHEGSQNYSGGALRLLSSVTIGILDKQKAEYLAENNVSEEEYIEE